MLFDTEKQKSIVLQLIKGATFTGQSLNDMYEFQKQVKEVEIKKEEIKEKKE